MEKPPPYAPVAPPSPHPLPACPPLGMRVEVGVAARDLEVLNLSVSNSPVCVLYMRDPITGEMSEMGRTEKRDGQLNPQWAKKFEIDYFFERRQVLHFKLVYWKKEGYDVSHQTPAGYVEVTLAEVMAAREGQLPLKLKDADGGVLLVSGVEMGATREVVRFAVQATGLDRRGWGGLSKSSPYLSISRVMGNNRPCDKLGLDDVVKDYDTVVHRTEVVKKSHSPVWKNFEVGAWALCFGEPSRRIKISCHSYDDVVEDNLIGECYVTLDQLKGMNVHNNTIDLVHPKKKRKKSSYTNSGQLIFTRSEVVEEPTFLDYIKGGLQIHYTVAVDFTASNGDPRDPNSLHHVGEGAYTDNQYSAAIRTVGEIIEPYDTDKLFPALGFGARVPPHYELSHEFFLNGSADNPYCQGIEGVLAAYQYAVRTVQLYGPSNLAPVINHVANFAAAHPDGNNYFVLLLLTNGVVTDMRATVAAIVRASVLPMSIICVGVGGGDFGDLRLIDGKDRPVNLDGAIAARDIVQVVEYRQHAAGQRGALARQVLGGVPRQVQAWMAHHRGQPAASAPPLPS